MLETPPKEYAPYAEFGLPRADLGALVRSSIAGIRRQWLIVALSVVIFAGLAVAYVLTATPQFTATASIIIDPRMSDGPDTPTAQMLLLSDALVVDSEVQVLLSKDLAERVAKDLKLDTDPRMQVKPDPLTAATGWARNLIGGGLSDKISAADRAHQEMIRNLQGALAVVRSGDTYVINISFSNPDPVFAASVANGFINDYFVMQADSTAENTRRISDWLSQRVSLLGNQVLAADQKVEDFKRENNLLSLKDGQSPTEMELAAANDTVINVRNQVVSLEASIAQLQQIVAGGALTASIDPAEQTQTLIALQKDYADAVGSERDITRQYGADHQLAVQARDRIAADAQQITDEFNKIIAAQQSRLAILTSQERDNEARISTLQRQADADNQKMINLRQLQRDADATQAQYQSMLTKLNDTVQQETFRSTTARVIATAVPPDKKSSPQSVVITILGVFAGLVLGLAGAFLREQLDRNFRTAAQAEEELGTPLIGVVPLFNIDKRLSRHLGRHRNTGPREKFGDFKAAARRAGAYRFVADSPGSKFAEAMRSLSFALQSGETSGGTARVIGFTSVEKGAGKSTVSSNFAAYAASVGERVVLIDLDIRNPTLTRVLGAKGEKQSLTALMAATDATAEMAPNQVLEGAAFLGNDGGADAQDPGDVGFMRSLDALIKQLRPNYDLILLDMPPLANIVDARVATAVADQIVLMVKWGKTNRVTARMLLQGNVPLQRRLVGAIYNKVNLKAYNRYNADVPLDYYGYTADRRGFWKRARG